MVAAGADARVDVSPDVGAWLCQIWVNTTPAPNESTIRRAVEEASPRLRVLIAVRVTLRAIFVSRV